MQPKKFQLLTLIFFLAGVTLMLLSSLFGYDSTSLGNQRAFSVSNNDKAIIFAVLGLLFMVPSSIILLKRYVSSRKGL